jgi:hypothetical protein
LVNAIKLYDISDMDGCVLFKVFTVYLRSQFHALARTGFDGGFTEKIHGFS